jgi:hypothetical protein
MLIVPIPERTDIDVPSTFNELMITVSKVKQRTVIKAGGKTGIISEFLIYGDTELLDRLLLIMKDLWRERTIVNDWKNAEIVPIPKR